MQGHFAVWSPSEKHGAVCALWRNRIPQNKNGIDRILGNKNRIHMVLLARPQKQKKLQQITFSAANEGANNQNERLSAVCFIGNSQKGWLAGWEEGRTSGVTLTERLLCSLNKTDYFARRAIAADGRISLVVAPPLHLSPVPGDKKTPSWPSQQHAAECY